MQYNNKKENNNEDCYITTACIKHLKEYFDDNCYELKTLRWFRDNFVSKEDINHYYEIAPKIVENINKQEDKELIYNDIYEYIIKICVQAINHEDYDFAYTRYKNNILRLEKEYVKRKIN